MIDEADGPSYEDVPEGLEKQVVDAVAARLQNKTFNESLGIGSASIREDRVLSIPHFTLAARQPVDLVQLHKRRSPSSWGFLIQLDSETGVDSVLASAGPHSAGGFAYSSILSLPSELLSSQVTELILKGMDRERFALLQVPSYYLQALWLRTEAPDTDRLIFVGKTFKPFPPFTVPPTPIKLTDFVRYMNDRLGQGNRAKLFIDDEPVGSEG